MGMAMRRLIKSEVHELATSALGLDSSALDLSSVECIAASLRRAASFLCPCSSRALIDVVFQSLVHVHEEIADFRGLIDDTLVAMVAYGDLVECNQEQTDEGRARALLYATPPTFVLRRDGSAFLIGITPDQTVPLPRALARGIEYSKHVRQLRPPEHEELRPQLQHYGLFEISLDQWLNIPGSFSPEGFVSHFDEALNTASRAGEVMDLWILDPSRAVRYYRGRWVEPRSRTGRFLARRRQLYGADLWCYLELETGVPTRLIDLPLIETRWRACDEAWRLLAAIDASKGSPQQYRVRSGPSKRDKILELFSPIPRWMQRRLDYIGEPVLSTGCLLSYAIPAAAMEEEESVLREKLWMQEIKTSR
jgi:hypothetical protein